MPLFLAWRRLLGHGWHFVIRPAMECPARFCLLSSAPLFEEEGYSCRSALCIEGFDPLVLHCSCSWPAFAANDGPVNASERDVSEVLQERLDGEEPALCGCALEMFDSGDAVAPVDRKSVV